MLQLDQLTNLIIEPTAYCNLHCPQCPRFDQEGYITADLNPSHLDVDLLEKNLNPSKLTSLQNVRFEGDHGDIMMHPSPSSLFDIFKNTQIIALTNGSMRSPIYWENLASRKNLTITFSVDGLANTNHIYRINSNFEKIMANATAFIDAGGNATWKFIAFKHNEHQIEQARKLSQDMGFLEFTIDHSNRSWFTGLKWAVKIDGEYQYDIEPSSVASLPMGFSPTQKIGGLLKLKLNDDKNDLSKVCWPISRKAVYISHSGHVLPCCMSSALVWGKNIQSKLWQKIIGNLDSININKNTLEDILNSEFYQKNLLSSLHSNRKHPVCMTNCM